MCCPRLEFCGKNRLVTFHLKKLQKTASEHNFSQATQSTVNKLIKEKLGHFFDNKFSITFIFYVSTASIKF